MSLPGRLLATLMVAASASSAPARGDDPPAPSFLKDVAPILVENCIGCHNARKSEGKYVMTTFAQLAAGGAQGKDATLVPGEPDDSYFVELIRPDAEPRMPFKLDPLPKDKVAVIESWVKAGARYDGTSPTEDWTAVLRKNAPVTIPESYPVAVPITALAFSPDGARVATSGYHELNLWSTSDGALSRRLRPLGERIYDIAYSPDGKWLATACGDPGQSGSARLWLAEPDGGGKPARDLVESSDSLFAVAFSPDSRRVAVAGADRAIRVFDVETGKELALIEDHADWILDLSFSPDGTRLASASRDKTAKVFDWAKRESLVTFPGHADTVYAVSFSPDGKSVATGGADAMIRIWNPDDDAKQIRAIGGSGGPVFRVLYSIAGNALISCGNDKAVRIFDASNGSARPALTGHADWIYALTLSPDGKTIASGSWDGEVRLWDIADGKPLRTIVAVPRAQFPGK